jgi:hypothetical protein
MSAAIRLFPNPGAGPARATHKPEFLKGSILEREEDGSHLRYVIETREGRILRTRFSKVGKEVPDLLPGAGVCAVLRNGEVLLMIALRQPTASPAVVP